jgi:hypothetical protein
MSEEVTLRLLNYLIADLAPHLPDGVGFRVTAHKKWTTVQRADEGSQDFFGVQTKIDRDAQGRPIGGHSGGAAVRNLVPSLPLIPRSTRRQIAAKSGLDILLGLAYHQPRKDGLSKGTDFGILTADRQSGVVVSYQLPGSDKRVELKPMPRELFE